MFVVRVFVFVSNLDVPATGAARPCATAALYGGHVSSIFFFRLEAVSAVLIVKGEDAAVSSTCFLRHFNRGNAIRELSPGVHVP